MSVKVTVELGKAYRKLSKSNIDKTIKFVANEVLTVTDPFVPFNKGFLKNSATIAVDGSFIMYNMPYARRLYYNPQYNFKGAPQRGRLWVQRSMAINGEAIAQATLRYMEGL